MTGESLWLLGLAVLYASLAIKLVDKNERLVIFQMGKPVSVGGPGLVITWPFLQSGTWVDISTRSMSLPEVKLPGIAQFSIVSGTFEFHIFDPLKAAATGNVGNATEQAIQSTLLSVVSIATIRQCLAERFVLESQSLELVNRQTRTWGVKVSALTVSDFRLHRQLAGKLAGIPWALVSEIAVMIEKVAELNGVDHAPDLENDNATIEHQLGYRFGINA